MIKTIKQFLIDYLIDNGLFPNAAKSVFEQLTADPVHLSMTERWSDIAEGYPRPLLAALVHDVNLQALRWIDANQPIHLARSHFADLVFCVPAIQSSEIPEGSK